MRIVGCIALLLATACGAPSTPPPRPFTAHFTVHCQDGADLVDTWVVTAAHNDRATWTEPRDNNNPHFGKFWYNLESETTPYELHVGCGRRSSDPSHSNYNEWRTDNWSANQGWGSDKHFECDPPYLPNSQNPERGTCAEAPTEVQIEAACARGTKANTVFVKPAVNAAGSATHVQGTTYKFALFTPITPYTVQITCAEADGRTWDALSTIPTIGKASFSCGRPQLPHQTTGECNRFTPIG